MFGEKTLQFRCLMSEIDVVELCRSLPKDVNVDYFKETQNGATLNSEYIMHFSPRVRSIFVFNYKCLYHIFLH
jgi:hypothetical protein